MDLSSSSPSNRNISVKGNGTLQNTSNQPPVLIMNLTNISNFNSVSTTLTGAATHLDDIKEEEDIELTRLQTDQSSLSITTPLDAANSFLTNNDNSSNNSEISAFSAPVNGMSPTGHSNTNNISHHDVKEILPESANKMNSHEEFSLLPPLPNPSELEIDNLEISTNVDEETKFYPPTHNTEEVTNNIAGATTTVGVVEPHILDKHMDEADPNTSFDLAKALEIPATTGRSNSVNTSGHDSNSNQLEQPAKITLKKISSTLLSDDLAIGAKDVSSLVEESTSLEKIASNSSTTNVPRYLANSSIRDSTDSPKHINLPHLNTSIERSVIESPYTATKGITGHIKTKSTNFSLEGTYLLSMNLPHMPSPTLKYDSNTTSPPKIGLIRRASSAMLRKASFKINKDIDVETPNTPGTISPSFSDIHNQMHLERTRTNSLSSNHSITLTRTSSISSKVKRGFSRIISSSNNNIKRVVSTSNFNLNKTAGTAMDTASSFDKNDGVLSPKNTKYTGVDYFNLPRRKDSVKTVSRIPLRSADQKIMVNISSLKEHVPTVYVTEDVTDLDVVSLIKQTGLLADKYGHGSDNIHVDEYLKLLAQTKKLEDQRFQIIEKNFEESGWCSVHELNNLRRKRMAINKMWSDKISNFDK
ncbi:hypothetical protein KAFR_0G03020 [Kazachstania africana CBS 2517]|uniref:Uncharacterized protein n=1 Tax=Kazachstania africana (strain ATCC 22294 / BCRC 22015 / CBS 2517 / CECT 1963 / NBRC 1671 / NRRL Y-8276) TaxID=1071382 RepID=H2AY84_KAZAF|nr:hypothetical protein KAFR_0G03020 [Kazachstania africana CBS 2517]CCF59334.1 hypothetical protein KAFR_0G03020 [Kazachstania africana CBS 2517]